jgi:uncharacterized protein YhbP (UPF0306 family)
MRNLALFSITDRQAKAAEVTLDADHILINPRVNPESVAELESFAKTSILYTEPSLDWDSLNKVTASLETKDNGWFMTVFFSFDDGQNCFVILKQGTNLTKVVRNQAPVTGNQKVFPDHLPFKIYEGVVPNIKK